MDLVEPGAAVAAFIFFATLALLVLATNFGDKLLARIVAWVLGSVPILLTLNLGVWMLRVALGFTTFEGN